MEEEQRTGLSTKVGTAVAGHSLFVMMCGAICQRHFRTPFSLTAARCHSLLPSGVARSIMLRRLTRFSRPTAARWARSHGVRSLRVKAAVNAHDDAKVCPSSLVLLSLQASIDNYKRSP